ncbi:GAF domain-containing sensor histidine kinase [Streptomyces sp. NP-1717]|uniref:sensor histidine kinase n=1 Tax=unclassified Streptomyces TaxID=2593676 RepID=UPI0035AD931C
MKAPEPEDLPEDFAEGDPDQGAATRETDAARRLQGRSTELTARVPQLLEAMRSVGTGLELHSTLDRICETAARLVGARYAALGVVDETGDGLSDFVTYGADEDVARRIGRRPDGHTGLLGELIRHPEAIRLADLTTDPRSAGFPPHHPVMRTFLGVPIRVHGEMLGNLYLTEKHDGGEFTDHDQHMVRVLATEAGLAIGNARLYEAARQRERWIDGSVAVTTALLSGKGADHPGHLEHPVGTDRTGRADSTEDTERTERADYADHAHHALTVVAEQARRLADSAAGLVLLPTSDGGLEIVAVSSDTPDVSVGTRIPGRSAIVAKLLAGESVYMEDASTDPRLVSPQAARFGPAMVLPLHSDGRVLGVLVTPRAIGGRPFTESERTLATRFASQAALALMMAEAQRDRERLAVFEDRDRIARDLHDLVIQRLFAAGMLLETAQRRSDVPEVRTGIGKAVDELDVTIQEIRTAIFALQQGSSEAPSGLRTRVLREINMAAVPLGFKPAPRFVGAVDSAVGELTGKNLIAALREALSNTFRHAHASRIEVTVDASAALPDGTPAVRLSVADDGVGIPEGDRRRSGLRNLRRRAESLGGSSEVGPGLGEDGGGTTVTWQAPL